MSLSSRIAANKAFKVATTTASKARSLDVSTQHYGVSVAETQAQDAVNDFFAAEVARLEASRGKK